MSQVCTCGCGRELTGKQTAFASNQCRHRVSWGRHKDRYKARRKAQRSKRRAAAILAAMAPKERCEHLRKDGGCWLYSEGCAMAKAKGRCTLVAPAPSVASVLALPPGRIRTSPVQRTKTCEICGVEFTTRSPSAKFCGNACRCKDYYQGRRERDGRDSKPLVMPAPRVGDGVRRCLWCQIPIEGHSNKRTCSRRCVDRVCAHNSGKSYSASVMTVRL